MTDAAEYKQKWIVTWTTDDGERRASGWEDFDSHEAAEAFIEHLKYGIKGENKLISFSVALQLHCTRRRHRGKAEEGA